jgi:Type VI secretion system, TssO
MSIALNEKEHTEAFLKFVLLLLITVAMVCGALYFNFQTPQKELTILRERSDLLRDQNLSQENYKRTLMEAIAIINRLDSNNSKAIISSELEPKLATLRNASTLEDTTATTRLNTVITDLLLRYRNARFDAQENKGFQEELQKKNNDIVELRQKLEECNNRVEMMR